MRIPAAVATIPLLLTLTALHPARLSGQAPTPASLGDSAADVLPIAADTSQKEVVKTNDQRGNDLRVAAHYPASKAVAHAAMAAPRRGLGQAQAMMVVGLGALLAGAIIGGTPGTIIMVGGAVVGLLGLYDYLQ
jgi:hypothetical protein